ncbi:MAG: hypothetical protein ABSF46_31220 [Terriglobia bacterium]|jgi:hypothetical protein
MPDRRGFLKIGMSALLCDGGAKSRLEPLPALGDAQVPIVIGPRASPVERLAARELSEHFQLLYPANRFPVVNSRSNSETRILLGTLQSLPEIGEHLSKDLVSRPGSYAISAYEAGDYREGIVAGVDERATLSAVYALLETLGYGFYLSYNARPQPSRDPIRFENWRLSDYPIVADRIAFTWHNFLSSCSMWDLADWEDWIAQVSRMRFSAIMVHAYGNNPMFTFAHNGESKPVGYLATSARGRDWGTEHVNDVRRIIGGDKIFTGPVFGAKAALAPEEQRVPATVSLMQQVFARAAQHGLKVIFALDVDTESSNPQNVIATLPEDAVFENGGFRLANPDAPAGYEYYRSQIKALLSAYPEIDRLAIWIRAGRNTPWCSLKIQNFPLPWRAEFQEALSHKAPSLEADPEAPSLFAVNKIRGAFRKALDEMGRNDVELALGSWNYAWIRAANAFFPSEVMFVPLDYYIGIGTDEVQRALQSASKNRKVVPIVWAHHDDRTFVGRPYTPFSRFTSLLSQSGSAGYGIIHWTTRPLDLYFKSLAQQVWNNTRDEPLEVTCGDMAERTFGQAAHQLATHYLVRWITEAPMFGRETTDRFIDRPLEEPERVITECRGRIEILNGISTDALSPAALEALNYYCDLERFTVAFYECHSAWERSMDLLSKQDVEGSREALASGDPKLALDEYARAASRGKPTRGEMGILVAMNLKWLPYMISQRQALGMETIRRHFEPTEHEALAQGPGNYTFYLGAEGELWKAEGQKETQHATFTLSSPPLASPENLREVCQSGLTSSTTIALRVTTIADQPLLPGVYNLRLLLLCPSREAEENSLLDMSLSESEGAIDVLQRIDVVRQAGGRDRVLQISLPVNIQAGSLSVRLEPVQGSIYLCGIKLEPQRR